MRVEQQEFLHGELEKAKEKIIKEPASNDRNPKRLKYLFKRSPPLSCKRIHTSSKNKGLRELTLNNYVPLIFD